MEKIRTRFGDGSPVELSTDEVRRDLEEGTREASERGNIPALTNEE
jgi:dimethylamine--corrinoid protein Co-methyltransferase